MTDQDVLAYNAEKASPVVGWHVQLKYLGDIAEHSHGTLYLWHHQSSLKFCSSDVLLVECFEFAQRIFAVWQGFADVIQASALVHHALQAVL
ncbi:Uncharacterised protein [Acinetobacter baumannii]|nr:Uncharacterised protein [Acinetobacter baumannii]